MKIELNNANVTHYIEKFQTLFLFILQECSVFIFEKRCAEKLHKPKRKETVTEILRASVRQLERFRHPKILHVLHPIEECADTLAFASEPVYASLANILACHEVSGSQSGINTASNQPPQRPQHAREYNFLDIEYKYGVLQVRLSWYVILIMCTVFHSIYFRISWNEIHTEMNAILVV